MRHSILVPLLTASLLGGCAHHLRYENVTDREEILELADISEAGELIVTLSATPFDLFIQLHREVDVAQDVEIIKEAEEVIIPWSPYALTQFLFISWNPVLWTFPDLYREAEGSDHSTLRDWLRLWNPFVRTGGRYEESRRAIELGRRTEHRVHGRRRLPLNETEVLVSLNAGGIIERLTRTTDRDGTIRLSFSTLPGAYSIERPITVWVEVEGRGARMAQLF